MSQVSSNGVIPIILCGGTGTRLWPISRRDLPKQFSDLLPGRSMFQQTLGWVAPKHGFAPAILVANLRHQDLVEQQGQAIKLVDHETLYEPESKNTAAAVLCAAIQAHSHNPEAIMLSLPSDHVLDDRKAFAKAVESATKLAKQNKLVIFGITPSTPDSAYGYIVPGRQIDNNAYQVRRFEEKPTREHAEKLLRDDNALWNSGMVMFKAAHLIHLMQTHQPQLIEQCRMALETGQETWNGIHLDANAYQKINDLSLDHGLLEKTNALACVRAEFRWSDAGSWNAIAELDKQGKRKNHEGNVLHGDTLQNNCRNTYLRSEHRLLTAVGVENLVVIETADAVLVADRDKVGDIKILVEQMKEANRTEICTSKSERRPWGGFASLHNGVMHQVKHIEVAPGGILSLQRHTFRSEHWVVVEGTAMVTICGETRELRANDSVYIPKGAVHRLANEKDRPLHLIEVQYGAYLGEDDIERLEDHYGRTTPRESQAEAADATDNPTIQDKEHVS